MASGLLHWPKGGVRMKKTVMTVIRVIVIVGVLGLLTYGGFVGMNRVYENSVFGAFAVPHACGDEPRRTLAN